MPVKGPCSMALPCRATMEFSINRARHLDSRRWAWASDSGDAGVLKRFCSSAVTLRVSALTGCVCILQPGTVLLPARPFICSSLSCHWMSGANSLDRPLVGDQAVTTEIHDPQRRAEYAHVA